MRKADLGDWFLIFLLSKNLDSILFKEFISQLSEKLKTEPWDDLIWDTDPSQVLLQVNLIFFFQPKITNLDKDGFNFAI